MQNITPESVLANIIGNQALREARLIAENAKLSIELVQTRGDVARLQSKLAARERPEREPELAFPASGNGGVNVDTA